MRRLPVGLALVALVITVVIAMVTGSTASAPSGEAIQTAPVVSTTLVCPAVDGRSTGTQAAVADVAGALIPPSTSSGLVTASDLVGHQEATKTLATTPSAVIASTPKVNTAVAVYANGSVAATVAADQVGVTGAGRFRALTDTRCEAPATDWWFVGADGRVGYTDTLILANPTPTAAKVTVAMMDTAGAVVDPNLQSTEVAPYQQVPILIAVAAPDKPVVAVHVIATSGAVTAALLDQRTTALSSDGGDYLPPTEAPSRRAVVAGYVASPGPQTLVIANPGTLDATVGLKVVTPTGSFIPVGDNQLVIKAGRTFEVSLSHAFAGTTGAVEVTSNQPVATEGLSVVTKTGGGRPDFTWLAAAAPLTSPAAVATGQEPVGKGLCLLLLTAPAAAAEVQVSTAGGATQTINVAAGHSVAVSIATALATATGPRSFVVTPVGSAPVYGVRTLMVADSTGELVTSEPLVGLPAPTVLPPVRDNPRVASR